MKKDYRVYIDDILEALGKIENYVKGLSFEKGRFTAVEALN